MNTPTSIEGDLDVRRLANELRRHRERLGLSMDELELVLDISKSTLSRVERRSGKPDMPTIAGLARCLGQPIDAFLTGNAGKIVHYPDAPLMDKIAAALYADQTLTMKARNALLDLMEAALGQVTERIEHDTET